MKFLAVAFVATLLSAEAFSQSRPGRHNPDRNPTPGRTNPGRYNPTPNRRPSFSCHNRDLYKNNFRFVHRFNFNRECGIALKEIANSGKFCDNYEMFDLNGRFLRSYRNSISCHSRLILK